MVKAAVLALAQLAVPVAASASHAGDAIVVMKNFDFSPMDIAVPVGATAT